jgi:deoxyadenosine/deoxycytidine kinase
MKKIYYFKEKKMKISKKNVFMDPWEIDDENPVKKKCYYICISGNSGSGKSSLLKKISKDLFEKDEYTIAIDEKSLHHPFIPTLFFNTADYGFQIQVNFMLQRTLIVKRWLGIGYNVIMERGHFEDPIFIDHLQQMGYINDKEYNAYMNLWDCLDKKIRQPDLILFSNIPPEISIKRVGDDEKAGRRPYEFPDEKTKETWIRSWHKFYIRRFKELSNSPLSKRIIELTEKSNKDNISKIVFEKLGI